MIYTYIITEVQGELFCTGQVLKSECGTPDYILETDTPIELCMNKFNIPDLRIIKNPEYVSTDTPTKEVPVYILQRVDMSVACDDIQRKKDTYTYLNSTDWYVTREVETGVKMPDEVRVKRQEARNVI